MLIRTYRNRDIPQISRLFYDTIQQINSRDYTRKQLDAWAPRVPDDDFWKERFRSYSVYVAEDDGRIVGFTELGAAGHIDCFFVHCERQRCGVGTRLMNRVVASAEKSRISRLYAEVSITAAPFFLDQGFEVLRESEAVRRGVKLRQFTMERWLAR